MPRPLNIVFLMADQWRWDTIFRPGHVCHTPNLQRLAQHGVAFHNAFTCYPLCSPARGSLFTGLWPHQTGLMDNVDGMMFFPKGKLHPARKTYLERLRDDAGYEVAYCGKWHLGAGTAVERGIPHVVASDGGIPERGRGALSAPQVDGETLSPYYSSFSRGKSRGQQVIEAGMDKLAELAGGDRPFCAVISTWGPHFPHKVNRRYLELYADLADELPANYSRPFVQENKPLMQSRPYWPCQNTRPLSVEAWGQTCRHYWAFCSHLDEQFGRVLDKLAELGIADNTVVAFAADHGEMLGAHGMFDKGPYLYEEIVHIPMIVLDPKGRCPVAPGGFVNLRDLFPTLISLAGVGESLSKEERSRSYWRTNNDCTYYCYDSYQGRQFKIRGIHTARYKYNWCPNDLGELYDLERDPGEQRNLINDKSCTEIKETLHARLMDWMTLENDYLSCHQYLLPVGSYLDGRAFEEQDDPGWSPAEWEWLRREK